MCGSRLPFRAALNEEKVRRGRGISDAELRGAEMKTAERREVFAKHIALQLPFLMPRVDGDEQYAVRQQQVQCRLDRGHGGLTHGGHVFLSATRQVAEVEHAGFDRLSDILSDQVVGGKDEFVVFRCAFRQEAGAGEVERFWISKA